MNDRKIRVPAFTNVENAVKTRNQVILIPGFMISLQGLTINP